MTAGPGNGLDFKRHDLQKIADSPASLDRVETGGKFRVLGRDSGRIPSFVPVVIMADCRTEFAILISPFRVVVS